MNNSKMHVILNNLFVSFGVIFFIASCNNNPVNSNKDGEIIFDHINFDIGITDKTDTTCSINLNASVIYHPENSGFQLMGEGYFFYTSDRHSGFGRSFSFNRYKLSSPRGVIENSRFINAEETDTLLYEVKHTDKEIGLYTIFEYQFFGIFTDERIESDFDTLAAKCFYYCVTDTVIY